MSHSPPQNLKHLVVSILLAAVWATASAQEPVRPGGLEVLGVSQWIEDLAATDFRTRRAALDSLRQAGEAAIEPLRLALPTGTLEQKVLIQSLLRELERNSLKARIARLRENPTEAAVAGLPEWNRFAAIIGKDPMAVRLYIRLLEAETELFATALKSPAKLPDQLEARATAWLRTTRPAPVTSAEFSVDSYAALLLFAGNEQNRLPRATSTAISAMLNCSAFRDAVRKDDGAWCLRLVGSYIQRPRIAVVVPLNFAREHRLPEGLTLARSVLRNALRGDNGLYAMMVILELGEDSDIPLIESLFDNRNSLFRSQGYEVHNGDLALAVAIMLRGKDPRDYGFPEIDDRSVPFRFSMGTSGFHSEAARKAARDRYAADFGVKN